MTNPLNDMGLLELRDEAVRLKGAIAALETKRASTVVSNPDASRREWVTSVYEADRIEREEIAPLRQELHTIEQQIVSLVIDMPDDVNALLRDCYLYRDNMIDSKMLLETALSVAPETYETIQSMFKKGE